MRRFATWLCVPSILSLALMGCGEESSGPAGGKNSSPPQLSTGQAAVVQEAAVGTVAEVQGPILADLMMMQTTGQATLLLGDASSFTLDTEIQSMLGGVIDLKGSGWSEAQSTLIELDVALAGVKGASGVVMDGTGEMSFDLRSMMPLELVVTYKAQLDLGGMLEAQNASIDLVISVSDSATTVCGTVVGINISDPACAGGSGLEPGEEPIDEPGEEPIDEPGEEPIDEPGEEPIDEPSECDQQSYLECTNTYNSCVNSCDPLDDYEWCVDLCTDDYCSCMYDANCADPQGRCEGL